MNLQLTRTTTTRDALIGELCVDGTFECYTLENRELAIPLGTYQIVIYDSPHAGHPVPILQNVPGRDFVEIHCGNTSADCKGCILLGQSHMSDSLENSRPAFAHLFSLIETALNKGEIVEITLS